MIFFSLSHLPSAAQRASNEGRWNDSVPIPASQPASQTDGRMRKADIGFGVLQRRCGLNLLSAVLGKETSGPVNALALVRYGIGVSERFIALPIWIRRPFLPFLVGILPLSSPIL